LSACCWSLTDLLKHVGSATVAVGLGFLGVFGVAGGFGVSGRGVGRALITASVTLLGAGFHAGLGNLFGMFGSSALGKSNPSFS
jgi:hypothetical protein